MSVMKYKDPTTGEVKKVGAPKADAQFKPAGKSYMTFSSPNSFTLAVGDATKHWDGTLEYFASNKTWTTWDGATTLSSVDNDGEHDLYLRGTGNTVITGTNSNYKWVLTGSDISCIGNIENLLDYAIVESGNHPTMADHCYAHMFRECTSLIQAPTLPATTLTISCYSFMFYSCKYLTQAPTLPATTLAWSCYQCMFRDCTTLTKAPALPATKLETYCYVSMFQGCISLTHAPILPATTLASNCYNGMFYGCTSLTQAPELPATTLDAECYNSMFNGCTSLIQAPALPATTLAESCYSGMFQGCTGLKLSATQTGEYTVAYRIPTTGTGTTANNDFVNMFASTGGTFTGTPEINTTYYLSSDNMVVHETEVATLREYVGSIAAPASHASDTSIHVSAEEKAAWNAKADAPFKPAGKSYLTFSSPNSFTLAVGDATKHWDGTLEYFASDKSWTTWDATSTLSSVDNDGEYVLYLRGTGNTVIGYHTATADTYITWVINGTDVRCNGNIETLLDYVTVEAGQHPAMAAECFYALFMGCTALTVAPTLPATTLAGYCYSHVFQNCASLTQAPTLPSTMLTDGCYYSMFRGCTSLTQAPALPATTLASDCYRSMFQGCTSLTQAPALPATTLANNCYYNMFRDCTGLTQAPALPATTLAVSCCDSMFRDCTGLTQVPALPVTTLASNCYDSMFRGCTGLKLSTTKTGEYTQEYRIPSSGTGTTATNALRNMFNNTGGTFTGIPEIDTTYYLSTDNMVVHETEIATLNGYVGSIAVPTSRKVNGKALSSDITLSASDVGARPSSWTPTASDVGAAPASHTSDSTVHVTAEEKAAWNAQADAPSYGPEDLEAGTSSLETGRLYFVYE